MPTSKNLIIGCVYRPPNSDVHDFNHELENLLQVVNKNKDHLCLLAGDFNLDLLNSNSHQPTQDFLNILSSCAMFPSIYNPTRVTDTCATLLDNIFTNCIKLDFKSAIILSDISDHYPVILHLNLNRPGPIPNNSSNIGVKRVYHPESVQKFVLQLSDRAYCLGSRV
jgi:hypothetical protein